MAGSTPSRLKRYWPDPVESLGILAMVLLVVASTMEGGTFAQKVIFAVTPPVLLAVAYANGEMMLATLEVVVLAGALLAFLPSVALSLRMLALLGPAVLGVAYLVRIDYHERDRYWPIGGAGLLLLATGITVSGTAPVLFDLLLVVGSVVLGAYSVLGFVVLGVRIQAIWVVLNLAFAVSPALRLLGRL
jgi:hypothetical protein